LKFIVSCFSLILSSKKMKIWQAIKDFNSPNSVDRVYTCLIKPICWEINSLRFYVRIYRINGVKFMYYVWIRECGGFGHAWAMMKKIFKLNTFKKHMIGPSCWHDGVSGQATSPATFGSGIG
jgi:hypothetical protein